jgi:hypothetical protein
MGEEGLFNIFFSPYRFIRSNTVRHAKQVLILKAFSLDISDACLYKKKP